MHLRIRLWAPQAFAVAGHMAGFLHPVARALAAAESDLALRGRFTAAVHFVTAARIRELNARHRGHDAATDVLSFPVHHATGPPPSLPASAAPADADLGDIFVAPDVVAADARAGGWPADAWMARVLVHGALHLVGFTHDADADHAAMEARERRVLCRAGLPFVGPGP